LWDNVGRNDDYEMSDSFSSRSYTHDVINSFLADTNLTRCDLGFTPSVSYTYANESQNYYS